MTFIGGIDLKENSILENVLYEFEKLAQIPRPSGHEKKVSDYIAERLKKLGLNVVQDQYNNIIADKKAAEGYENVPRILLQGHMDMVCVADPNIEYNPLQDAIKIKNDGKYLTAEGTSLGADDGIGIASIIYLLTQNFIHGPLRIIFTVDEEDGMTGARGLDKKYLQDIKYVINCDSEDYDVVTVGSAGSVRLNFNKEAEYEAPKNNSACQIIIKKLLGGHSGTEINQNRGNAIKTLAFFLQRLQDKAVDFALADIKGGVADNAIAPEAQAVIVADDADMAKIQTILDEVKAEFVEMHGHVEKNSEFILTTADMPQQVLAAGSANALIALLNILHSGVFAMSPKAARLPELSANIGRVCLENKKIKVSILARSATNASLENLKNSYRVFAKVAGFAIEFAPTSPAWNGKPDTDLVQLAAEVFKQQNNKEMKVEFIHGGLECNYFADKNPELIIISIGPNNIDIHTPQEKLQLDTIVPQVLLMQEIMTRLAKGGK